MLGQAHLQALVSLTALAASSKMVEALTIDATSALAAPLASECDD
jgi:hypothetical protein